MDGGNGTMFVSDDDRRTLIEWIANEPFCVSKAVIAKSTKAIGDHFHRHKNEKFLLLTGKARKVILGDVIQRNMKAPHVFDVPKGMYHLFELEPGSILLGVADKPHDPDDEVRRA